MECLFPGEWTATLSRPAGLLSPLGVFTLGFDPVAGFPHREFQNTRGDRLLIWSDGATLHAELLIRVIEPGIPKGMRIDGCVAAVWRVKALAGEMQDYVFWCEAPHQMLRFRHGGCAGQGLEAQEWNSGQTTVSMGTQNAESMIAFRRTGKLFPVRWLRDAVWIEDKASEAPLANYTDRGFNLRPPALRAGESLQIQFIVAWASEPHDDASTACWFAVDQTPTHILRD